MQEYGAIMFQFRNLQAGQVFILTKNFAIMDSRVCCGTKNATR
jgi:hypothetical protein